MRHVCGHLRINATPYPARLGPNLEMNLRASPSCSSNPDAIPATLTARPRSALWRSSSPGPPTTRPTPSATHWPTSTARWACAPLAGKCEGRDTRPRMQCPGNWTGRTSDAQAHGLTCSRRTGDARSPLQLRPRPLRVADRRHRRWI